MARLAVRLDAPPAGGRRRVRPSEADRFDWTAVADHCRTAWLRGAFLAHGSLSLGTGRSHLELVLDPEAAAELAPRLVALGHPAAIRTRRGRGVLTWKSADAILELLRRLGASASALELETRLVTHQLHGHLNRVLNAETANLRRSAGAAARQVLAIDRLRRGSGWAELAAHERAVAEARVADPGATLAEIADALGIGRARVQRAFVRIERLAEEERPDVG